MKHGVLLLGMLFLLSCGKEDQDRAPRLDLEIPDGFCLVIGDSLAIPHTEMDYYDLSTHMVYLKDEHEFLSEDHNWDAAYRSFTVYANKDSIYSGTFWPMWSSAIYEGPCIHWPSFYPAYAFKISNGYPGFYEGLEQDEDPRKDSRIIAALEAYDQLRNGLSCTLDHIEAHPGGQLSFRFTLTNLDEDNYYVLSPDRMGIELFHYFTNGLYLWNEHTAYLEHRNKVEGPEPWDSWSSSWFELLEGKQSKSFTIHYTEFDPIPAGSYEVSFMFPGLSHVKLGEMHRTNGRIWLGGIYTRSEVTFQ